MGLIVLAKDVRAADVAYLRSEVSFTPRELYVERVEVLANSVRLWGPGHSTFLLHPYDVVAVERAD